MTAWECNAPTLPPGEDPGAIMPLNQHRGSRAGPRVFARGQHSGRGGGSNLPIPFGGETL